MLAAVVPALPPLGRESARRLLLWPPRSILFSAYRPAAAQISVRPGRHRGESAGLLYDVAEIDREQRGREAAG
jgi:hypothetical protein